MHKLYKPSNSGSLDVNTSVPLGFLTREQVESLQQVAQPLLKGVLLSASASAWDTQEIITYVCNLICIRLLSNKMLLIPLLSCCFLAAAFCFLVRFLKPATDNYLWMGFQFNGAVSTLPGDSHAFYQMVRIWNWNKILAIAFHFA